MSAESACPAVCVQSSQAHDVALAVCRPEGCRGCEVRSEGQNRPVTFACQPNDFCFVLAGRWDSFVGPCGRSLGNRRFGPFKSVPDGLLRGQSVGLWVVVPWVLEGNLVALIWCQEMALEFVCRADFWCNRHCRTTPVVLEGFGGQVWPKICRKPTRIFPARLLSS